MKLAAVKEVRKPGRPRKFAEGRINATVRFTPERYAELKAVADKNGRSVSEQVEAMIEELHYVQTTLAAMRTDTVALEQAVFRRRHDPQHTSYGPVWWPKTHPHAPSHRVLVDSKGKQKSGPSTSGFFKMRGKK
jgi:hypothetical protein